MDISPVLSLGSNMASSEGKPAIGEDFSLQDSVLFSLILGNILGMNQKAKEQATEGLLSGTMFSENFVLTDDIFRENIIGQNLFLQTLQNFPAGKDANSGLNGEQNLEDGLLAQMALALVKQGENSESVVATLNKLLNIHGEEAQSRSSLDQISSQADARYSRLISPEEPVLETVMPQKDSGLEGSKNLLSREISSLSPAELDKYINTLSLLKELSGQVKTISGQNPNSVDSIQKTVFLAALQQQILQGQQDLGNQQNIQDNKVHLPDSAQGRSLTAQTADQNSISSFINKGSDTVDEQISTGNSKSAAPEGIKATESSANTGRQDFNYQEKSLSEPIHTKSEPNTFLPTQNNVNRTEASGASERAIPNPDVFSTKVIDQVMDHLRKQDFSQIKELSVQLHPADLGKVNFSVRMENGQVHLVIHASESSTASFLQNNLADLRQGLSQNGINCGTFEMGTNHNGEHNSQRQFTGEEHSFLKPEEEKNYYPEYISDRWLNHTGSRINFKA